MGTNANTWSAMASPGDTQHVLSCALTASLQPQLTSTTQTSASTLLLCSPEMHIDLITCYVLLTVGCAQILSNFPR